MKFTKELDASGLTCPLHIIRTKKALSGMASGQVLRVVSTDPGSQHDMTRLAAQSGDTLLKQHSENSKFIFYLRKA